MKRYIVTIFLISLLITSCKFNEEIKHQEIPKETLQEKSSFETLISRDEYLRVESEKNKILSELSNDSLWNHLLFDKGGCLTGNQHVYAGKFGGEGCVMSNDELWNIFFDRDRKELSEFLMSRISKDTTKTNIHTCPFYRATEGEVAVYSLQNLYSLNWYDFDEFKKFQNRQSESSLENHQAWLQTILKDRKKREILINCWAKKVR